MIPFPSVDGYKKKKYLQDSLDLGYIFLCHSQKSVRAEMFFIFANVH